jgi:hypothetical protein
VSDERERVDPRDGDTCTRAYARGYADALEAAAKVCEGIAAYTVSAGVGSHTPYSETRSEPNYALGNAFADAIRRLGSAPKP